MSAGENEAAGVVEAARAGREVAAGDFDDPAWALARAARIERYWSGEDAPEGRRAEARVLWDERGLAVRFDCRQAEPLVVSAEPRLDRKTLSLWDRDVCELFITPGEGPVTRYYEFEVAPTGEWVDLSLRVLPEGRETDWDFRSGMTAAARVGAGSVTMGLRVPWPALGRAPRAGDRWRCNLFRCVGRDPDRGYLAWRPTRTPEPGFHVPEKFGWMAFKG
ncbi:MAG TPA: carbohydrate-binding family 9-like protein [Pyrinomonadaceae bacterium]|jgi:hypothetical protein